MNVLFVNPPDDLQAFLGAGVAFLPKFEPLGLLYVAAVTRQRGHAVRVIDAVAENLRVDELKARIVQENPDVVGITAFTSNGGVVYDLGKWLKRERPEVFVVLGNIHPSVFAEAYLRNQCCDAVVHGEGEYVFQELLEAHSEKRDFEGIRGVSWLKEGNLVSGESVVVDVLADLPLPARDLVDQKNYFIPDLTNMQFSGKRSTHGKHMFTSRGCPRQCTFCVVHKNNRQRGNDVIRVVDEMEHLNRRYGADYIFVMDSLFISDRNRVIEICREIRRRRLDFIWGCEGHADFIDPELVREMEAGGCFDMAFGVESGVQRLLNNVKKGTTLERVRQAIRTVRRNSAIKMTGLFILGLPGETYEDSLQTIEFAKSLPIEMAQFSILVPYPGSRLFMELAERGEIETGIKPDGTIDPSVWLRYSSYIAFTGNKPIWVTPGLSHEALKGLQKKALRDFYLRPRQIKHQLQRVKFEDLGKYIKLFFQTFI